MRYNALAIAFHWVIAAGIAVQLTLGWWMVALPDTGGVQARWFNVHKSIGLTLAVLAAGALVWRLRRGPPPLPDSVPGWQQRLARFTHLSLYACLLLLPITGYLGSSFSGYPVRYFGYALPAWGWKWPAAKELLSALHLSFTWLLAVLLLLHIAGALLHLLRGDGLFQRMWPKWRNA